MTFVNQIRQLTKSFFETKSFRVERAISNSNQSIAFYQDKIIVESLELWPDKYFENFNQLLLFIKSQVAEKTGQKPLDSKLLKILQYTESLKLYEETKKRYEKDGIRALLD
jgi:hypothetical protein